MNKDTKQNQNSQVWMLVIDHWPLAIGWVDRVRWVVQNSSPVLGEVPGGRRGLSFFLAISHWL
ncbi:MAG: hypothetical protein J6Q20_01560, partial [Alistipes sp.]|nr:hypothetical protein [Alistipes sp.]